MNTKAEKTEFLNLIKEAQPSDLEYNKKQDKFFLNIEKDTYYIHIEAEHLDSDSLGVYSNVIDLESYDINDNDRGICFTTKEEIENREFINEVDKEMNFLIKEWF